MNRSTLVRWGAGLAAVALLTACSNSSSSTTSSSAAATDTSSASSSASDPFATPNKATGTPIVVGLLNLEQGPVTFPGYRQAAEAAASYINDYMGGVGGHPLQIESCPTDGQPATSQRCANQILDKKPAFILGGADTGAPGAYPVWERAGLAVVGAVPFTPVEQNYKNGIIFSAIAGPDNAAAATYASQQGAKTGTVVYTSDTQGTRTGDGAKQYMKNLGFTTVNSVPVAPTAADVSTQAATVVTQNPDTVFVTTPVGCGSMLKSLDQLGFKGTKLVIDPCADPKVIAAAGNGANGMTWGGPINPPASDADSTLMMAVLQKYAPDAAPITITFMGLQAVMNIQKYLSPIADSLTEASIVGAFQKGTDNPNFAAHPFTCDNKQIPGSISICNGYQHIFQYANGKTTVIGDWVNPAPAMGG
jgi:branched-chain amino acid transport system substrate-binding protein